jgi:peptide/nickel transport system substrate-binding protein
LEDTLQEVMGYDPDGARQLLLDNGFTEGDDGRMMKDGEPLTLRFVESEDNADSAELIILSLEDIGITVESRVVDFGGKIEALFSTGEWDVSTLPYGPPVPLPSAAMAFLDGEQATNTGHFNNETFREEAAMAFATTGDESCGHWANAQRALLENYDYKPLLATESNWFGDGVEFTLFNRYLGTFDPMSVRIVGE